MVTSFFLSASLHVLLVLTFQLNLFGSLAADVASSSIALTVDLLPPERPGPGSGSPPPPAAIGPPPAVPAPVKASRPKVVTPRRAPQAIDGVRLANAEEVRIRRLMELTPTIVAEPAVPPPPAPAPVIAAAAPAPAVSAAAPSVADPTIVALASFARGAGTTTTSTYWPGGEGGGGRGRGFRPDTPGYYGRMFGQVSVASANASGSYYGRIHLFPESGWRRDYSGKSLFGYSFRHELGDGAVREFQTGRTQTPGAYLIVTDLFPNGRISTMSHTVILAFPRVAARGSALYTVVEDSGDFRLIGPGGAFLRFDGRNGFLEETRGFTVSRQAGIGTPPRVRFRGLHLRIEAVGANPFLRDRAARVIDARGRECAVSTSELFAYEGRDESDMFRFADDRAFFRFLGRRCRDLALPRPAPPLVTVAAKKPGEDSGASGSGGLLGFFGASR